MAWLAMRPSLCEPLEIWSGVPNTPFCIVVTNASLPPQSSMAGVDPTPRKAMVGLPDTRLGERNCLCVIPKSGRDLSLDEAVAFLKGQIADYKLPESIERFSELPMTGSGKIQRHVLRDLVSQRRATTSQ